MTASGNASRSFLVLPIHTSGLIAGVGSLAMDRIIPKWIWRLQDAHARLATGEFGQIYLQFGMPTASRADAESHTFFVRFLGSQPPPRQAPSGQLPSAKESDDRPTFPARCGHVPQFRAASGQYVVCMTMKIASPKLVSAMVAQTVPETV